MFAATPFRDKTVAVFGLARSGLACLDALLEGGANAFAWDDNADAVERVRQQGKPVKDLRACDFAAVDALVLSPGVPLTHPEPHWTVKEAKAAGVEVIGDTEVFARAIAHTGARMIAITGTNGKSTTTALIGHILLSGGFDAHVGGNIGKAVFLLPPPKPERVYVLELSSYQIDLMPSLKPDVGILLNLAPDHLDRHGDIAGYAGVKARMFSRQDSGDTSIISVDDQHCHAIADSLGDAADVIRISVRQRLDDGVSVVDGVLAESSHGRELAQIDLTPMRSLRGQHNWQNACAAFAAARALGMNAETIAAGMASFPGLRHRMEEVGRIGRIVFINDSKATNADAAAHALASFEHIYWIAGGRAKEGGISDLLPLMDRVVRTYLVGEAAKDFARTLEGRMPVDLSGDIKTAIERAVCDAANDGAEEIAVLLSPACASFDQFPDFEARGDAFRTAVLALNGIIPSNKEAA